jgi:DNA polymerase III alpha subunit
MVVEGGIRLGLMSIKNVGPATCSVIEEYRPFESYEDFDQRVPRQACNITARAALIMAGAFDQWGKRDDFTEEHIDICERDLLGMSLTSVHSIAAYSDAIEGHFWTEDEFDEAEDGTRVAVVGEVSEVKEWQDSRGGGMAFVDLVYGPNRYSCTVFASLYDIYSDLINSRRPLLVMGVKNTHNGRAGIRVESMPVTNDEDWMAPIVDLGNYVDLLGDQEEQFATDSVYPEDLEELANI